DADCDTEREADQRRIERLHRVRPDRGKAGPQRHQDLARPRQHDVGDVEDQAQHLPGHEEAEDADERQNLTADILVHLASSWTARAATMRSRSRWVRETNSG